MSDGEQGPQRLPPCLAPWPVYPLENRHITCLLPLGHDGNHETGIQGVTWKIEVP